MYVNNPSFVWTQKGLLVSNRQSILMMIIFSAPSQFLFSDLHHRITLNTIAKTNKSNKLFQPCTMSTNSITFLHPRRSNQLQRREGNSDLAVVPVHIHHISHRKQAREANLPRTSHPSIHCADHSPP